MKEYIKAVEFIEKYTGKKFIIKPNNRLYKKYVKIFIDNNIEEATTKATDITLEQ
jgi:hypothetical protein